MAIKSTHNSLTTSLVIGQSLIATAAINIAAGLAPAADNVLAANLLKLVDNLRAATRDSEHLLGSLELLAVLLRLTATRLQDESFG